MKISMQKEVAVDAKTLKLYLKVSDRFCATLVDQDDEELVTQLDDYVPKFMPGEHFGDYVILDIELDTGRILNWTPPTAKDIEEFIEKNR